MYTLLFQKRPSRADVNWLGRVRAGVLLLLRELGERLQFGPERSIHGLAPFSVLSLLQAASTQWCKGLAPGKRKETPDLPPKQKKDAQDALENQGVEPCTSRTL